MLLSRHAPKLHSLDLSFDYTVLIHALLRHPPVMQRNKTISYTADDLDYPDAEPDYDEEASYEYTEEDKLNFATLTPVVRAEIEEAGLQASDREIEDALWDSYWDVGECVAWLKKNAKRKGGGESGKGGGGGKGEKGGKTTGEKVKNRFDQAAERNSGGEFEVSFFGCAEIGAPGIEGDAMNVPAEARRGGSYTSTYESEYALTVKQWNRFRETFRTVCLGLQTFLGRMYPLGCRATSFHHQAAFSVRSSLVAPRN